MTHIELQTSIQDRATTLLEMLGVFPSTVALTLHLLDVKGERCRPDKCPIATYLVQSIPEVVFVAVAADIIEIHYGDLDNDGWPKFGSPWIAIPTPSPVATFIKSFDHGEFKELVAT